ncbi:hypothetical protein MLD38_020156 [Melastoma candidum]|uniref:Uncharacterized protein n=1 Tax=Melastoma candidum TaxID=119954 RepID=A0ACB9QF19_9MYRT|nr:hypothetical protein MLD38_020156 [Melastoma candidum]
MPGLADRNNYDQLLSGSNINLNANNNNGVSTKGFWSRHQDVVSYNHLQKFWNELSLQARQQLLKIDKHMLFEQARKNMYCSRCNGLLLEGFLQIVMYGKSFQQEGGVEIQHSERGTAYSKTQSDSALRVTHRCQDELQDPSVHPWGGLATTRDGSLTLLECYLSSKSLKGLQMVFDSACARERERELLYPDACGGGGRGWISQGTTSYGRGHGMRETCALHTARLSCDTLVDFWSALGEETRQSLLRMKEEDFIERLMYRFDSKRFCRDCRKNVIREFKELKELKRMRKEPRCTSCFCVADTAFQYEVSDDTVHADWHEAFADSVGSYHHFEWAIGTGEGKADILEYENVGLNGRVQVSGLDLGGLNACFITLRAWRYDGRCTEISVKAHNLNGQECVHGRLIVGDGLVTITRGESIRMFFEHAEEAEEEEDDDSMDKDRNDLDGECSRPQKHAKSPELAREFLLDAAVVIFKEQVEKAFREGTARQNAHSIFVCLALKLLEERVHIACKEIITLEKQMKLLEEEEKEKREEEERKERKKTKEREKKLRRKERLRGKERDKDRMGSLLEDEHSGAHLLKEEILPLAVDDQDEMDDSRDSSCETVGNVDSKPASLEFKEEVASSIIERTLNEGSEVELADVKDGPESFTAENSKVSFRRFRHSNLGSNDQSFWWSDRRRVPPPSEGNSSSHRTESRYHSDNSGEIQPRGIYVLNRQSRTNVPKLESRIGGHKCNEKFQYARSRTSDRYNGHTCGCNDSIAQRVKVSPHVSAIRLGHDSMYLTSSESVFDASKHFYRGGKYNQVDYAPHSNGRLKSRINYGNNPTKDSLQFRKIWEPLESQKKYPRSNSESDVTVISSNFMGQAEESGDGKPSGGQCSSEDCGDSVGVANEDSAQKDCEVEGCAENEYCQGEVNAGAANTCHSFEANDDEVGSHLAKDHASDGSCETIESSSSNSDHSSSCLSETDSNTSANHGSVDSSSTSDSEEASPLSDRKEALSCNGVSKEGEVELGAKEDVHGSDSFKGQQPVIEFPLDSKENNMASYRQIRGSLPANDTSRTLGVTPEHPGIVPVPGQNVYFQLFQGPTAMGYYPQNMISWPPVHTNGMMSPFPYHANYLFPGLPQFGMDRNSGFCMQYGGPQHAPPNLSHVGTIPTFHPAAKPNGMVSSEEIRVSKPNGVRELNGVKKERFLPGRAKPAEAPPTKASSEDTGFSLFQFGGPVGLSTISKSQTEGGAAGDLSTKVSKGPANVIPDCNGKDACVGEYNLFAASNGISFSLY